MSWDEIDRISAEGLEELERRIYKLYKDAAKEMSGTIKRYFEQLIKRDEAMKDALEKGEITKKQYTLWRIAQIGRGKRYEDLRDKLAERASKANETAVAYVNDTTPGVYTLNRNYAAYNIEKSYGNIGFTVWNEEAVRRIVLSDPDLMPYYPPKRALNRGIDLAYGREQITAQILSSILLGDGIPTIADKLQNRIETMSRTSAIRTARTAYTAAQNGGRQATFEKAAEMGIKVRKRWVATKDLRTRYNHAAADGQVVDYDKPYIVGGEKLMFPGDGSMGASAGNLYNCRCAERSVEKEGIEAEPRQMRVMNPEWERAKAEEDRLKDKVDSLKAREKAESDPGKRKKLRSERLALQKALAAAKEKTRSLKKKVLINEMIYPEWFKWKTGEDFPTKGKNALVKTVNRSIIKDASVTKSTNIVTKAINEGLVSIKVNADKQSRHIFGDEKYIPGRSYIYGTLEEAQNLIDQLSGTGTAIMDSNGNWTNKERVRNEAIIGVHIQPDTKEQTETKNATIVYSKSGSHIIPRREDEE